jgi:NADH-quinone oxidoreductase subunit A
MLSDYVPLLIYLLICGFIASVALILPPLLGPRKANKAKNEPYESGKLPYGSARRPVAVHYYMVALLFILFDLEVVFIYPWAVIFRQLKWFGIAEMGVFLAILVFGYIYIWKKKGLDWD